MLNAFYDKEIPFSNELPRPKDTMRGIKIETSVGELTHKLIKKYESTTK